MAFHAGYVVCHWPSSCELEAGLDSAAAVVDTMEVRKVVEVVGAVVGVRHGVSEELEEEVVEGSVGSGTTEVEWLSDGAGFTGTWSPDPVGKGSGITETVAVKVRNVVGSDAVLRMVAVSREVDSEMEVDVASRSVTVVTAGGAGTTIVAVASCSVVGG